MTARRICGFAASILLGLMAAVSPAAAAEVALLKPFGTVSIHSPIQPVPPGGPLPYTASGPAASWGVVAWDIPGGDLSAFTSTQGGAGPISTSHAAEATVSVAQSPADGPVISLSQDGAILPCQTAGGQPRESDLLLSPNRGNNHFDVSGYLSQSHAYALTSLHHLTASATVSYSATPSARPEVCGVAQGSALMAVILNNPVRHQTLFYQLALTLVCGPQPAPRLAFCAKMRAEPWSNFFFTKNPFGVDDRLPLLGQAFLTSGETRTIHVDLLPRLIGFLRAGPLSLDTDPSHWTIGGFYAGQDIWGGVKLTTHWSSVQLVADVAD
ncbi:hypothetical protein ACELLULO517_13210 [Acidisoma cellulosilytica]|uniref:Secreted protein n=1 Tax=Acidisoma cellulosilyticum TaxID=2802395 RepID=A0A963Z1T5_9PROT|nr:hypothetical protein [Acidisoma cellulosilyticum]MCB8881200.1 hypothetical protein [Acidisoma cellulosilyticum]